MSFSTHIYHKIKKNILTQKYPAGFHLKEIMLSKAFETTRTPLREALIKLEKEGLVKVIPNKGAFVIRLSKKEIEDLFEVREALEVKAGHIAIQKSTKEQLQKIKRDLEEREMLFKGNKIKNYRIPQKDFHFSILKLTKNKILISYWKTLNSRLSLIRIASAMQNERFLKTIKDHKEILHNIYSGNYSETEKSIKNHNREVKKNLLLHYNMSAK